MLSASGPFHMWDELKAPIVPMLIFGAYDLYPVGSWVNQTGHIAVRYLPPILHTEAADKDAMLILVRERASFYYVLTCGFPYHFVCVCLLMDMYMLNIVYVLLMSLFYSYSVLIIFTLAQAPHAGGDRPVPPGCG